ncbi:MAG: hypothetical protein JO119_20005 [Acidobacteria bacterium]|nr:hypothetical protein [Acidobacteriota bacterium]
MKVSRREFVSTAGCAASASLCALPTFGFAANNSGLRAPASCALLDLKSNCVLRESLEGYRIGLGTEHRSLSEGGLDALGVHGTIIVPAVGTIDLATASALTAALNSGATVVLESGAAFLSASDFAAHHSVLAEYFGISIGRSTELWMANAPKRIPGDSLRRTGKQTAAGHESVPYVTYQWPHETCVRDFSRAIPVSAKTGRAIAHLGELPVAWSKSIGNGKFVYLGSPIGPAIRAGDAEAHAWLRAIIAKSV